MIAWYARSMSELTIARQAIAHRGRRLEYFTIVWNSLEGLIAIAAGAVSESISLVGFGIDSFIEVTSGDPEESPLHRIHRPRPYEARTFC